MDTRFWGPSGWRLLHLITFTYEPERDKKNVCYFFNMLPYVLPCKFCRASLSEYIIEEPVESVCDSAEKLQRWLWRIHNKVSAKLRKSALMKEMEDPSFSKVAKFYKEKMAVGCTRTVFDGWNFLFSIAENHPLSRAGRVSIPLPGAPPLEEGETSPLLRNRWNMMAPEERMEFYLAFWRLVPLVLPFKEWRDGWIRVSDTGVSDTSYLTEWGTRKEALATLWKIRSSLEKELELVNRTNFNSLCKVLASVRSGCGSKTCRKKRL